jgi:hypothetical protein
VHPPGCRAPRAAVSRPRLELADIVRRHGGAFGKSHVLTGWQRKALADIGRCRTAALGGHLDVCDTCGHEEPSYNSCRNRHCPKCQATAQAKWIEARKERILPTHYFHVVFTLPARLRPLARRQPREMFDLLFTTASRTLLDLGHDEKRLGATLGLTAVLHTWTRELHFHPHLHLVVTGGGLTEDGERWISARRRYLFPVKVLSRLFRGKFLAALQAAVKKGQIRLFDDEDLDRLLGRLYREAWVVFAKRPFGGARHVFEYLGRYTHRVAISNQRLVATDEEGVRFLTKDGRTVNVPAVEFLRRFLLHVLPRSYVKIRHYGLLAPGNVGTRLETARRRLEESGAAGDGLPQKPPPSILEDCPPRPCPRCRTGRMTIRRSLGGIARAPPRSGEAIHAKAC